MVKVWAEKEMRNLKRIHASAIPCPRQIYLRLNVLVMAFLGDQKGTPAPGLKDVELIGTDAEQSGDDGPDGDEPADQFARRTPRGKGFEDKEAKKEHKKQVKEEKKVQQENKMPKRVKKRLVNNSSRKKH
ncbi:protein kinase rio1 [Puttea exsequens]|nr:protein kinase rio1 [Puttea exsequens]